MTDKIIFFDVDTQRDFIEPTGKLYVKGAEQIKPNLAKLTQYARMNGIRIVGSVDYHTPEDPEIDKENPDFKNTYPPHCLHGDPGSEKIMETRSEMAQWVDSITYPEEKIEEIVNSKAPIYFRKNRFDVFTNPNTEKVLDKLNPEKIVVYGVAADVCVKHAIEGLLKKGGHEIYLVIDAIEGLDEENTRELINEWVNKGVKTVTTEAVLQGKIL